MNNNENVNKLTDVMTKAGRLDNKGARFDGLMAKTAFKNYLIAGGFSPGVIDFSLSVGLMKNINKAF